MRRNIKVMKKKVNIEKASRVSLIGVSVCVADSLRVPPPLTHHHPVNPKPARLLQSLPFRRCRN